jgi:hypothetical protein
VRTYTHTREQIRMKDEVLATMEKLAEQANTAA